MRRVVGVLLFIGLVVVVPARGVLCQEPQSNLVSELQELSARMDRAMVEGDVETGLAFYADDAVVLPNNAPKIVGKAALRKSWDDQRKSGVTFGSFTGKVEQAWECGGMVYSVGSYAMSANVPGVPRPMADKGKYLAVYRRAADGKLQIVYDIWNTDVEYGK